MNLQRQVALQNDLIRRELGDSDFSHAWKQAETLLMPMILMNENGKDEMEYVCACGVDTVIHRPTCRSLSVARKKVDVVRILPGDQWADRWVVCRLFHFDYREWIASYGTHVNFPNQGVWMPLSVGAGYIKMSKGVAPTQEATYALIALIRKTREVSGKQAMQMEADEIDAHEKAGHDHIRAHVKEVCQPGLNLMPGKKYNTSYPGRVTKMIESPHGAQR